MSAAKSVGKGTFGDIKAFCDSSCDTWWSTMGLEICVPSGDTRLPAGAGGGCAPSLPLCLCSPTSLRTRSWRSASAFPQRFHRVVKTDGKHGVCAVGEGKGWGGRCIPPCATGGWLRRVESCENREVPQADVGGPASPSTTRAVPWLPLLSRCVVLTWFLPVS